jgi:hypothetical protein
MVMKINPEVIDIHQCTGDGAGPPHDVPGIGRRLDIDHDDGADKLRAEWAA